MNTNLTTTQIKILREAAESPIGCAFVESSVGRGAMGGKINTGSRASDAARSLCDLGLLRLDNATTSAFPRNGYTVHTTTTCYELTDAGRAALAA